MTDGFQSLLLKGLVVYLPAHSIGVYSDTATYTIDQTALVIGDLPDYPDNVIALDTYPVSDSPSLSSSVIAIQVRCRARGEDPLLVKDMADLVYNQLHGAVGITLSTGVKITQCQRNSGPASLGKDSSKRRMNVTNYYANVWRPSTHRT